MRSNPISYWSHRASFRNHNSLQMYIQVSVAPLAVGTEIYLVVFLSLFERIPRQFLQKYSSSISKLLCISYRLTSSDAVKTYTSKTLLNPRITTNRIQFYVGSTERVWIGIFRLEWHWNQTCGLWGWKFGGRIQRVKAMNEFQLNFEGRCLRFLWRVY